MTVPERTDGAGVPATSHGAALLVSPVRRAVVDTLAQLPPEASGVGLSAAELGLHLGLHPTTIRFHVDQLVTAGVLEAHFVRSGAAGRPSKKYLLRADPLGRRADEAADGSPFEILAGLLAETLSTGETERLTPEEAGVRWAQRRAQEMTRPPHGDVPDVPGGTVPASSDASTREEIAAAVTGLLGEWGYRPGSSPSPDGTAVDITLRDCPFLELAHTHPDVVCGVHRGLLRGALGAVGADDSRVSLHPFVTATTCRARLYLDGAGRTPSVLDPLPVPAVPAPGLHGEPEGHDPRPARRARTTTRPRSPAPDS